MENLFEITASNCNPSAGKTTPNTVELNIIKRDLLAGKSIYAQGEEFFLPTILAEKLAFPKSSESRGQFTSTLLALLDAKTDSEKLAAAEKLQELIAPDLQALATRIQLHSKIH